MTAPTSHRWLGPLADLLVRRRVAFLVLGLVLMGAAVAPALRLKLDESVESFYAPNDPLLRSYLDGKAWFGADDFVLVGYQDPDLLTAEHLQELGAFSDKYRDPAAFPGLRNGSTQDLAHTLDLEGAPFLDALPRLIRGVVRRLMRERIIEFSSHVLISAPDETAIPATSIILRLRPEAESPVSRRETFADIRKVAADHQPPAYVAGEPIQIHDMFRYVERDGTVLGMASSGLLILVILIMFRSLRWVTLPLLLVHASLVWTKALLVISGLKLSMVSSMLNSLVMIVGIATATHVTITFREFREHLDRYQAFRATFLRLAGPIFWTTVTTAIGFGSLLSSTITPVRSFGLMMALGTLLVMVAALLLLPGGALIGRFDADPRGAPAEKQLMGILSRITDALDRYPKTILCVMLLMAGTAGLGLLRLRVETDFSKNFRESSQIVQSLEFFERNLGGVGNWELNFSAPHELTEEYLDSVRDMANRLRELELPDGTRLTKVISYTDGLDFLPERLGTSLEVRRQVLNEFQPDFEPSLYNASAGRMRLILRAHEQQPAEIKLTLIRSVEQAARTQFPDARATGLYVLLAHLISSLMNNQLTSFALSSVGIVLCMTIAYRSLWVGLISLVPNVFPILLVIGGMGWTGIPVNIGTAMIASVSMGLTVDSSIHYLSGYQRARLAGADHLAAVRSTHAGVGRALVFANVALILGFTVLSLSEFIPLVFFGTLVSAAMLGGLIGNLIILPLLLRWIPWLRDDVVTAPVQG